ncbi:MAG TPA: hypothetical protein VGK02_04950 [Candidatus Aquicultor sp.]
MNKLRIGLLLDSYDTPAWVYQVIKNIKGSAYARIDLVVIKNSLRDKPNAARINGVTSLLARKSLELIYKKLIERKYFIANANKKENCEQLLAGAPTLNVNVERKESSNYFCHEDIEQVKSHNIDILVNLGFGALNGCILNAARYGVWSYHHGDNCINRGGPPGFWESMENWPETGSVLQILTDDPDNSKVLCRSFSCTFNMSVTDTINNCFWKSPSFITRKIKELHEIGEEAFFTKVDYDNRHPLLYSERLYTDPTNYELVKLVLRKLKERARSFCENRLFTQHWILMFDLKEGFSSSLYRYKKIIPPKDRFWADPHVIYKDNKYYIYVEEYPYSTRKGHISLIVMDDNGNYGEPEIVLEKPYHLSYPFVFEHENDYYMIPESSANRTVELYKCTKFPDKWEFQMNLMEDIWAADATLYYHKNKWWMFANVVETDGASSWDELFLFYADDLFSNEWQSHPLNPIISDCKTSRPAGKLFLNNGSLYRVSQNNSTRYGYGINIHEITALDENTYDEVLVSSAKPNWDKNITRIHTFNRVNSLHIIDAYYRRRKWHRY